MKASSKTRTETTNRLEGGELETKTTYKNLWKRADVAAIEEGVIGALPVRSPPRRTKAGALSLVLSLPRLAKKGQEENHR